VSRGEARPGVERFGFEPDKAISPSNELLERVTIAPLTASMQSGSKFQAAVFRLGLNGGIRRHPASVPQIIAVLEGTGEISGSEGTFEKVAKGDAVFFSEGEEHETRTDEGMVALILEGPDLTPFTDLP
jgi:quercetin dioxygenase-like cupin family protein